MLKKFTEFSDNQKLTEKSDKENTAQKSVKVDSRVNTPKPETTKIKKPDKIKEPVTPEPKMEKTTFDLPGNLKFEFNGKVANMPTDIKPSVSIVILENNKISKDKLHYIISNQTKDTLVVLKYNENAEIKLSEFSETFMNYLKQKTKIFDNVIVEGTEHFSIIKNIPDIELADNTKAIDFLNDNLTQLLK